MRDLSPGFVNDFRVDRGVFTFCFSGGSYNASLPLNSGALSAQIERFMPDFRLTSSAARWRGPLVTLVAVLGLSSHEVQAQVDDGSASVSGPIRLRQTQPSNQSVQRSREDDTGAYSDGYTVYDDATGYDESSTSRDAQGRSSTSTQGDRSNAATTSSGRSPVLVRRPTPLDEFERYVASLNVQANSSAPGMAPPPVRRFGSELFTGRNTFDAAEANAVVPADYIVGPGDDLQIQLWGSVDADLSTQVDRSGRITLPRVGTIMVGGVPYAKLPDLIARRVAQSFRNFQLSVSLGQVRSVRIYVTGNVKRPGAYTVSSLSSVAGALMRAGGPTSAGSMRRIELRRDKKVVTRYDLYDLLLKGDRSSDRVVQSGDVIHVGAVGPQVAIIGSVNKPAIFELKEGETAQDVVQMAGGFSAVGDRSRLAIERLEDRSTNRISEVALPAQSKLALANGDVLRAFSAVDAVQPMARQNKRIRIEGEVVRPGEYVLPAGVTVRSVLQLAGGFTPNAYVYGTEFNRESVRKVQQQNYERVLNDMETEIARSSATQRAISADEAKTFEQRQSATDALMEKLRKVRPTGRVVLKVSPQDRELPDLTLEDGDRIYVPARPTTVGVFGSVFNAGAFLVESDKTLGDYLYQAGGPTKGADDGSTFVLRPNGSVLSQLQKSSFFGLVGGIGNVAAEPGDTVFVPERMNKTTYVQDLKEWTQILYQFGLGAAALATLKN